MMRLLRLFLALFVLAACSQAVVAPPTPVTVTISGSTEMRPLLNELTAAYSQRHPNVLFSLRGGGSLLGEDWVAGGRADLAASTSFPQEPEANAALLRVPIGLDGVAVIVNGDNPVETLTLAQLRDLYSGRLLSWQDVGGAAEDVLLVSREDGSATRSLFEERVMGEERVTLTAVVMPTSEHVVRHVARQPHAIGYVSRAYVWGDAFPAPEAAQVRVVAIEDRLPDSQSVAEQRYPLTRPLFLVRRRGSAAQAQAFIDFVLSPAGQEIVARFHVPIR